MSEHRLQMACAAFLSASLDSDTYWTAVDAGQGAMNIRAGQLRKARGVKAGVPDIIVVHNATFHGIELKTEKGRTSDTQSYAHEQIRAAGGRVCICRSVADVEVALRHWFVPLKATTLTAQERDARLAVAPKPAKAKAARGAAPTRTQAKILARIRAGGVFV